MEIFIIILLAIVILFLIWDRFQEGRRWWEQRDDLSKTIGERLVGSMGVFGEVNKSLGKLE